MGHALSLRARVVTAVAPLIVVMTIFASILASEPPLFRTDAPHPIPREPKVAERCTWYCHNNGCPHASRLPDALTSDAGLFGYTVRALSAAGHRVSSRRGFGYRAVNLVVFVLVWPGVMHVLAVVALRQRLRLRELRGRRCR
jgi:hypothetical protein